MKAEERVIKTYKKIAKDYHEKITRGNHFYNKYLDEPMILKLVGNVKGKRVLDLGCGSGKYSKILLRKGGRVTGVDISPDFISLAKKEVPKVEFHVASAYKLPFKNNYFDMVVAGLVVEHFENLNKAFKEIRRVLKKNGVFVFSLGVPLRKAEKAKRSYFKEGKILSEWPTFGVKMFHFYYTLETWIRSILKNGFEIVDFAESRPSAAAKKYFPKEYKKESKNPMFCAFKVKKK